MNPLDLLLSGQGYAVLDGGLACALKSRGANLSSKLWCAKILIDDPDLLKSVHTEYFEAGADICITGSYQASFQGFQEYDVADEEAESLMQLSVTLALRARDEFYENNRSLRKAKPLVAASIGCYGACLADGSEYTGDYNLSIHELVAWHRPRMATIIKAKPDLIACETIPGLKEVAALSRLVNEFPGVYAWISVSCEDETHLRNGDLLFDLYSTIEENDAGNQICGVGINCTHPRFIDGCIRNIHRSASSSSSPVKRAVVVYPNSGKEWDSSRKVFIESTNEENKLVEMCVDWRNSGASVIGGCCEVGPVTISRIRDELRLNRFAASNV